MITEDGKIEFNEQEQAEVNRIVGERLSREGINDMKEIVETLKDFGYDGDTASVKAAIKEQAEEYKRQQEQEQHEEELEALKEQAEKEGTSPELLAEIKALKAELADIKGERQAIKEAETQQIEAETLFNDQVKYFEENVDGIDLAKLNENPKFVKFLQKQRPTGKEDFLAEVYSDFVELIGNSEAEAIAKIKSNLDRSTSSGRNKGDSNGGTYGLSQSDINTVDDWNRKNPQMKMSYKEFSERR